MVAHECEADHADRLEHAGSEHREPLSGITLELGWYARTLDKHGGDNCDHAEESEKRSACKLVDRTMQRERVRHADSTERDDELAPR